MKTIGVLGGVGPQATMDFEARLHREAQRVIPQRFNSGYPPMVVLYMRHPPVRFGADGKPALPLEADPRLLESAARLGTLADFIVIPSNTPHLFATEVERAAGRPLLNMVALAIDEVKARGWRRVGVVGFSNPVFYTGPLGALGLEVKTLDQPLRDELDQCIGAVMEGRDDDAARAVALRVVETLRKGVDGVVLGCTEIPLLLRERAEAPGLLDPLSLLAAAAVRRAME